MRTRLLVFHYFLLIVSSTLFAQEKFSLTGLLEPDYRQSYLKLENGDIIFIAKTKGLQGAKEPYYNLERYTPTLKKLWEQTFAISQFENIVKMEFWDEKIILFSVDHNTDKATSNLITRKFSVNGVDLGTDTLVRSKIEPWMNYLGKGAVKQGFVDAICSIQNKGFVTPLEYKYYIETSPHRKKLLIYRYDYSKMGLWTHSFVYDEKLNLIEHGEVPIDKGFTCYGQTINDRGDLYIYKVNASGRVALMQYNIGTEKNIYLEVHTANSSRENLKIHLVDDDILYLAKLNKKNGELVGLTYSRFDFSREVKEYTNFHAFNIELKREINKKQDEAGLHIEDHWDEYDLVDFEVDSAENITFFIEKSYIVSEDYRYDETAVENKNLWTPHIGEVFTETLLMFSFDYNNRLRWDNFVVKKQEMGIVDGINSASFIIDNQLDDRYRIVYATKTSPSAVLLNQIHYLEIDKQNGKFLKEDLIDNPLKLSLSRPYSFFDEVEDGARFIFVGKKGLFGKKTFISSLKL